MLPTLGPGIIGGLGTAHALDPGTKNGEVVRKTQFSRLFFHFLRSMNTGKKETPEALILVKQLFCKKKNFTETLTSIFSPKDSATSAVHWEDQGRATAGIGSVGRQRERAHTPSRSRLPRSGRWSNRGLGVCGGGTSF